jgi:hypothetical protein
MPKILTQSIIPASKPTIPEQPMLRCTTKYQPCTPASARTIQRAQIATNSQHEKKAE